MSMIVRCTVLVLLMSLVSGVLSAQTPPKREFRAAWLATVDNLDWPVRGDTPQNQKNQLLVLLDGMKAAGINTVIFQVRPECDALYASPYEPWSYHLTGTQGSGPSPFYDPLEYAVQEAHKRGMELHAWFNPYRAEKAINRYPLASSHVYVQHPDWILTFPSSNLRILNPGLEQVREFVARVAADIVRRYDVDGIHADDYFYPYSPIISTEDAATFTAYPRGFTNIGDWRRDNVNLLMKMIMDSVNVIKPYVKFGMSPFGIWKNGVPPGITGLDAYGSIYGDAIAWLHQKSVDYLTPQLYWKIGGSQDYLKLSAWWADSCARNGRHLYPGLASYRMSSGSGDWPASEILSQVRVNRGNAKIQGEVYFRAALGLIENTKGFADSLRLGMYSSPALLPQMMWKDTIAPFMPRNIRYEKISPSAPAAILWDLPLSAPDGDSAKRYAVYRFNHTPSLPAELADPRNMVDVVGARSFTPPTPPPGGPYSYVVTALDRNYNESEASSILLIGAPAVPVLASPGPLAIEMPESLTVRWKSDPLVASYHVQVSLDSAFAGTLIVNDSTVTDTARVVRGYPGLAAVYWRVRARNAAGASAFSAPRVFYGGFPAVALGVYPPNSSLDIPTSAALRWGIAPAAATYRVQVALATTFAPALVDTAGLVDTTFSPVGMQNYKIYFWRVKATNTFGTSDWSIAYRFRTVQATGVEEEEFPSEYTLAQNYPNPFNPVTTIRFTVPRSGYVRLNVFDLLGREVASLVDSELPAGAYAVQWDGSGAASGMYVYRMQAGDFVRINRMLLLR